jgi:NADP-dependent 3-hydroxy acid dehydrogenase YdfG
LQQEVAGTGVRVTDIYPGKMFTKLFEKVGIEKDMTGAIETEKVANLVKMIVETESDIHIPEIGIKSEDYSIKQSK